MSRPFIFLRANTEEIRTRLKNEGFRVCCCAEFDGAIWLDGCHWDDCDHVDVHGVGCSDESDEYWNQPPDVVVERTLEDERDCGNKIVDCGTDVDRFVTELKQLTDI